MEKDTKNAIIGIITALVLTAAIVFIWPVFAIMAVNQLFNTGIDLTFGNWVAATFLGIFFRGFGNWKQGASK